MCRIRQSDGCLAHFHRSLGIPDDDLITWLLDQGVSEQSMLHPYPIAGGRGRFIGRFFKVDDEGAPVITFRAEDRGYVIDLIAFQPFTREVASIYGFAFCLGDLDDLFNPATYFNNGALRVHGSPLEWLKAHREGVVILRPGLAYRLLGDVPGLSFADPAHAQTVQRWLKPPVPRVKLFVEVPSRDARQ